MKIAGGACYIKNEKFYIILLAKVSEIITDVGSSQWL
jgi:hypothetical protein